MTAVTPLPAPQDFMQPRLRRWTPSELRRMTQAGVFDPSESVHLVDGEVYAHGQIHAWTRDEYYRLGDGGLLPPDERTELLDGRIVRKVTLNPPHATAVRKTAEAQRIAFGSGFFLSMQLPLDLSVKSEPEPDIMVTTGTLDDYADHHPTPAQAVLVAEASDTTLKQDRTYKAQLYATSGCPDYWIVNINSRTLGVHRQPQGGEYLSLKIYNEGEAVAPLAAPGAPVRVSDLLPLKRPQ